MSGLDAYHARLIRRNKAKAVAGRGLARLLGWAVGWTLALGFGGLALGALAWVAVAVFGALGGGR